MLLTLLYCKSRVLAKILKYGVRLTDTETLIDVLLALL